MERWWQVQRGDEVALERALARSRTQINGHQFALSRRVGSAGFRTCDGSVSHGKRLMRRVFWSKIMDTTSQYVGRVEPRCACSYRWMVLQPCGPWPWRLEACGNGGLAPVGS